MKCEDELQMWLTRVDQFQEAIIESLQVIETLRDRGNFTPQQKGEITSKIQEIQSVLIPF
jgi:hypothetical protein